MKSLIFYLISLCALRVQASHCENPFPARLYNEAIDLFPKLLESTRSHFEPAAAVDLHDKIIKGHLDYDGFGENRQIRQVINTRVGRNQVNALHIAAAMQQCNILQQLIELGGDINAKDRRGFTPAHFAALGSSRECLDILFENQADFSAVNEFGAKPEQVWTLTHLKASEAQAIYFRCWISGALLKMDGEHFCLATGNYFSEGIKQTPASVLKTWREEFAAQEHPSAKVLTDRVHTFRSHGGLYLANKRPLKLNDFFTANDFGLHANREFEIGDVVEVFGGLWDPQHNSKIHGVFSLDTEKLKGHLSFVYDKGLPNVVFVQFFNRFGVSQGHFAMAIRRINRGDPIVRERLIGEKSAGLHDEIAKEALDEFITKHTLTGIMQSKQSFGLEAVRNRAVLNYLIENKNILLRLRNQGLVSNEELAISGQLK